MVRIDRIGDVLLTLPMADALKSRYPDAVIDLLVQSRVYELIFDYPNINKVHSIEKVTSKAVKGVCTSGNYDLGIAVYPTFSVALGLYLGGVKYRLGTAFRWYSFLFNIKHYQQRKDSIKHESEYNIDLLSELNLVYNKWLSVNLKVEDECIASANSKLRAAGVNPDYDYIVVHISSLSSAKVWSDDNFKALLKMILEDVNNCYQVVLTGTIEDKVQVKHITDSLSQNNRIFTLFNLNLKELAAVIKGAKLFIGNSTGPIHIAAAVNTHIVGLYSPVKVESPVRWGPLTENKKIFVPEHDDNLSDVMNEIKPVEVYNYINSYLRKK
ncbi:MAG: glycosyltransferase family 9 protein [Ignavibacteria bacterium]